MVPHLLCMVPWTHWWATRCNQTISVLGGAGSCILRQDRICFRQFCSPMRWLAVVKLFGSLFRGALADKSRQGGTSCWGMFLLGVLWKRQSVLSSRNLIRQAIQKGPKCGTTQLTYAALCGLPRHAASQKASKWRHFLRSAIEALNPLLPANSLSCPTVDLPRIFANTVWCW